MPCPVTTPGKVRRLHQDSNLRSWLRSPVVRSSEFVHPACLDSIARLLGSRDHSAHPGSPFSRSRPGKRRAGRNRMNRHSGAVASNNVGFLPRVGPLRWRPRPRIFRIMKRPRDRPPRAGDGLSQVTVLQTVTAQPSTATLTWADYALYGSMSVPSRRLSYIPRAGEVGPAAVQPGPFSPGGTGGSRREPISLDLPRVI
jgi:hypothetical protein